MKMSSMPRSPDLQVLALDIGSSSVRSALFDQHGHRIAKSSASREYAIRYTTDEGAELDANVVLRATQACVHESEKFADKNAALVISGSAFWHALLGVNRHGDAITPIYTWADARAAVAAAELRDELVEREVQLRTGCMLRAPFWPAKFRWLKRRDVAQWLSPAAWIFEKIFGVGLTSHSMASGTGLYNLYGRKWDRELCEVCSVDVERFGPIGDQDENIFAAIGDGAASNLGSGADGSGKLAVNIGTSAAARMIVPDYWDQVPFGFFLYEVDEERMVLGGAISNAGNLHQWCERELRLEDAEKALSRTAAAEDALTVLPFWVSERAPNWPENLRGTIVGLRAMTSAGDVLRAITTSVFYQLKSVIDELPDAKEIIVSGGILRSPASLAILADSLGRDLRIASEMESSLRGAAIYALEQLDCRPAPLPIGQLVKHNRALAAKHRERRSRQEELERTLTG